MKAHINSTFEGSKFYRMPVSLLYGCDSEHPSSSIYPSIRMLPASKIPSRFPLETTEMDHARIAAAILNPDNLSITDIPIKASSQEEARSKIYPTLEYIMQKHNRKMIPLTLAECQDESNVHVICDNRYRWRYNSTDGIIVKFETVFQDETIIASDMAIINVGKCASDMAYRLINQSLVNLRSTFHFKYLKNATISGMI